MVWAYYQNVRGLRTKIDSCFLTAQDCNFDIIILTETGLDERINSILLFGTSYSVYRCDRSELNSDKSSFGGVLIAVSQRYPSALIETTHGRNLEQVCVSCTIRGLRLLVCAVYIPPEKSRLTDVIEAHVASIRELSDIRLGDDAILVCGDYNQPRLTWTCRDQELVAVDSRLTASSSALVDGMNFLNLRQFNMITNRLGRVLDLVFGDENLHITIDESISPLLPIDHHHPPLVISTPTIDTTPRLHTTTDRPVRLLNYRRIDFSALRAHLEGIDWDTRLSDLDVDEMTGAFCNEIGQWFDLNLPVKQKPVSPVWSTPLLRDLRRKKNACQRKLRRQRDPVTKRDFRNASEAYRRVNAMLYRSYVQRVQIGLRHNPRGFWNFVNSKRKNPSVPSNVFLENSLANSNASACELFKEYFSSVFAENGASGDEVDAAVASVPLNIVDLDLFCVTPEMVISATKKLKKSYSPGPDGVPAIVYSRCCDAISEPLCRIFNKSFDQRAYPSVWTKSTMFPVFKKGDRHNVKNYRGITSLSAGSKVFEIIVGNFILNRTINYISSDQHGFIPERSVTTNLLEFTTMCANEMENKAQVDVIYTDLKAAFDRIDHEILLHKLLKMGMSERFVSWLRSYLVGRTLRVQVGSEVSSSFTNQSGVPQGSNLGPLLFSLYINDVAMLLGPKCKSIFADDFKLYVAVRTIDDCHRLQALLDLFASWCHRNRLIISIAKCSAMTFHRIQRPILFDYNIDGIQLARVEEVRDLGVQLDAKLTFIPHMTGIIAKANRQLGFISKIGRDFSDPYCLKSLYCALVRPILENASIIWTPYQLTWSLRIERVQKRFIRLALRNLPWRDPVNLPPYPERCRLLNLDTLERRRRLAQATTAAKIINNELNVPGLLSLIDFRTSRRTRNNSAFHHRFHRTSFGFNEPFSAMMRTFASVEEEFEFNEPVRLFVNRLNRRRLL